MKKLKWHTEQRIINDYIFNLKLDKEELKYLLELIEKKKHNTYKKHKFHLEDKKKIEKQEKKEHFLLSLSIKLKNKYLELG